MPWAKRASTGSACSRAGLGEADRYLLQRQHGVAGVGGQDLADVLDGDDRIAAGHLDRRRNHARAHLLDRVGELIGQLFRPHPAEVSPDSRR